MKTKSIIILLLLFAGCRLKSQVYESLENRKGLDNVTEASGITSPATISIIYDNYVFLEGTSSDWGFSVLIDGLEKKLIFDTGTKPEIFEANIKKTGLNASATDILVISHEHGDHTGGIPAFVKMKTGIPIIIPHSFSSNFKTRVTGYGLKPLLVDGPSEICSNLYSSGVFDYKIAEHSLVLDTKKGLVVITGCAHPGIIAMVRKIKADFNKNIYMVMGGFHLMNKSEAETRDIIAEMKQLGVVRCGATHCTGDMQIGMFRQAFGDNYVEMGTGNRIVVD